MTDKDPAREAAEKIAKALSFRDSWAEDGAYEWAIKVATNIIRTAFAEALGDGKRLDWLLEQLAKRQNIHMTKNPYTGTFITEDRFMGYCDGEERWEQNRLARGPKGDDGRAAIDAAREGGDE